MSDCRVSAWPRPDEPSPPERGRDWNRGLCSRGKHSDSTAQLTWDGRRWFLCVVCLRDTAAGVTCDGCKSRRPSQGEEGSGVKWVVLFCLLSELDGESSDKRVHVEMASRWLGKTRKRLLSTTNHHHHHRLPVYPFFSSLFSRLTLVSSICTHSVFRSKVSCVPAVVVATVVAVIKLPIPYTPSLILP